MRMGWGWDGDEDGMGMGMMGMVGTVRLMTINGSEYCRMDLIVLYGMGLRRSQRVLIGFVCLDIAHFHNIIQSMPQ